MNKICTSLEQSKKLIELGIDIKTADFMWEYNPDKETYWDKPTIIPIDDYIFVNDIPAWSLSALLELMNVNEYKMALKYGDCSEYTMCFDDNYTFNSITKDDSVDAAFKMFVWLKENNKI